MQLAPGTHIGAYDVLAKLGEGGMGAVYRARDTKLKRDVAIKVLPADVAADGARLARFQREAEVLAALNHPHIASIYGLEDAGGTIALVMELVEGEDLSARIARGPIPLDEALPIARQIAEALEAAHEQGIVHRDLKPANIKVRPDGTVKVLDFGLAKAMDPATPASSEAMQATTITTPAMTQAGMILGTAAYMSPEQASGKPVDKRTDLWAFGVVLLEMLTGQQVFGGESVTHVLAAVLKDQPDFSALPAETPASVRRLLRRCLQKEKKQRLPDAAAARLEIEDALAGPTADAVPLVATAPTSSRRTTMAWSVATAALLGMVALAVPVLRHLREAAAVEMRTDITTPPTDAPESFALAPDGSQIAFVATGERGRDQLWLRALGTAAVQPLAGTEGARYPFWSPDGQALGFFVGGQLKRVDVASGIVRMLAAATSAGHGGTWNREGAILFTPNLSPVLRVSADGGDVSPVTTLAGGTGHRHPTFLPDGRHFLFWVGGAGDAGGIFLASLDGGAPVRLTASDTAAAYAGSGWMLWTAGGTLLAQKLDLDRRALSGVRVTLAAGAMGDSSGAPGVSTAATGLVAYRRVGEGRLRQLQWFDRSGTPRGAIGPRDATLHNMRLSPDARRVAVARTAPGTTNADVWLLDGTREIRLTNSEDSDSWPAWAPDSTSLAFSTRLAGTYQLRRKPASGAAQEQAIGRFDGSAFVNDWSHDGRFLLFMTIGPNTRGELWVAPLHGEGAPARLRSSFTELGGFFSPDDRWIAYDQLDKAGQSEVVIRAFVPPGSSGAGTDGAARWQVSSGGGRTPRWRADGRELFYLGPDGSMMAAPITVHGATLDVGAPVALFSRPVPPGVTAGYDVAPDGRFLINTTVGEAVAPPIVLVQHWAPEAGK